MSSWKYFIKKNFGKWLYREKISAARKNALEKNNPQLAWPLAQASFDIFTDQGEDGIIYHLLNKINRAEHVFVDIGSGDCIKSNCANLVVNYGWKGLFIDKNGEQLEIGKKFYHALGVDRGLVFKESRVTGANINQLIREAGIDSSPGLLSIDIDGNDYWIWQAIEGINPTIVVIEAKVEFGEKDIVIPYGEHNHHSVDKMYNGASVQALVNLGRQKGYKLAGANRFGYNLFFVQQAEPITESTVDEVLSNPVTRESFYADDFFDNKVFDKAR